MKLSDSLRGMADRAPVGDVSVSAVSAAQRVRRNRAIRTTANSVVGVGAVGVVALGVILPMQNNPTTLAADAPEGMREDSSITSTVEDSLPAHDFACGETMSLQPWTLPVEVAPPTEIGPVELYSAPDISIRLSATDSLHVTAQPPRTYVLWNDIVVAMSYSQTVAQTISGSEGTSWSSSGYVEPYNCFNGDALPPGEYTVVTTQALSEVVSVAVDDTEAVAPDQKVSDETAPSAPSDQDAALRSELVWTEPTRMVILGEVPDNPFEDLLNQPEVVEPTNLLTTDVARIEYQNGLTNAPWDMAKGTQRTVLVSDSADVTGEYSYLTCGFDDDPVRFPNSSSAWSPIAVTGIVPSSLTLQHSWVVKDNPVVNLRAVNSSGYSLADVYDVSSSFLLVKDGQIVAETYMTALDPFRQDYDWSSPMASGDAFENHFLWRELFGCYDKNGFSTVIEAGSYTVLHVQSVYVSAQGLRIPLEPVWENEAAVIPHGAGEQGADVAVRVADEYLDFQIFTSLGRVNVSHL